MVNERGAGRCDCCCCCWCCRFRCCRLMKGRVYQAELRILRSLGTNWQVPTQSVLPCWLSQQKANRCTRLDAELRWCLRAATGVRAVVRLQLSPARGPAALLCPPPWPTRQAVAHSLGRSLTASLNSGHHWLLHSASLAAALTNGHHPLHVVLGAHVVALHQAQHPDADEPHSGAKCHVPHGESDGEGEAGVGEQPEWRGRWQEGGWGRTSGKVAGGARAGGWLNVPHPGSGADQGRGRGWQVPPSCALSRG